MNQNYIIDFTNQPSTQELKIICDGLDEHAKKTMGKTSFEPFGFLVRDNSHTLIAGCTGVLIYGVLYIKLLWVNEKIRGEGIGKKLIEKTEHFAKENHCSYITVDTFDWQAKEFYEKMGFQIEHAYDGYLNNSKFYFLRKKV